MKVKRIRHLGLIGLLLALMIGGAGLLLYNGYHHYLRTAYPLQYTDYITAYGNDYGISPSLAAAVICVESHFQPLAESGAGAIGLMQLTPSTFNWAQVRAGVKSPQEAEALYDPETNIRFGVYTLKLLFAQFEDEEVVLAAYNAGQGTVRRWLRNPAYSTDGMHLDTIPYAETATYVKRVKKAQTIYHKLYAMDERNE